jgi:hypothetical protein
VHHDIRHPHHGMLTQRHDVLAALPNSCSLWTVCRQVSHVGNEDRHKQNMRPFDVFCLVLTWSHAHWETAQSHWSTSVAWKRTVGGIMRPIALAALRLMTNSNCIGCSTGRSAGFAPFSILST